VVAAWEGVLGTESAPVDGARVRTDAHTGHIQLFASSGDGLVHWRLLSGNNREAGRGSDGFPDAETCRLAIKHFQVNVADFETSVRRSGAGTWTWDLSFDGRPVAYSGHRFDRLIRCELSLSRFVERLPLCEIGANVMFSDARRWRTAVS
jgi:hypothetical protein